MAAQLPVGEVCYSIFAYLGMLALGTSKGVRVGILDDQGHLSYGPLVVTTTSPVRCVTGRDRFIYAGYTNQISSLSGLVRIDLGQENSSGEFAYASDLQTKIAGNVTSVCVFGASDRMVIGVNASGSYLESATTKEASGFVLSYRVRFGTVEPKLYKFLAIRTTPLSGSIVVESVSLAGATTSLATWTAPQTPSDDIPINAPQGPQEYVAFRFTLVRSATDVTAGPTMTAWQLKALPGVRRPLLRTIPLLCYDHEVDARGKPAGNRGSADDRLNALLEVTRSGDVVSFQALQDGTLEEVVVDDLMFEEQVPPPGRNEGQGGVITVVLRTIQ